MAMLEVNRLTVDFGGLRALNDVHLSVDKGDFIGLIGPNGAGKTTLFNAITGVVKASGGTIELEGKSLRGMRPDKIAMLGISRTFQNIRLFPKMRAVENVEIGINRHARYNMLDAMVGTPRRKRIDIESRELALGYLDQVGILQYQDAYAGELPYGIQRRLEIARAIATKPKILFLDEPAAGMNNEETAELIGFLDQLHKQSEMAIVLIEHHLEVVMQLCRNITVLSLGSMLAHGTPEAVQNDPEVIRAYIGERRERRHG